MPYRTKEAQKDYRTRNSKPCANPKCKRLIGKNSKHPFCFWCQRMNNFFNDKPLSYSYACRNQYGVYRINNLQT